MTEGIWHCLKCGYKGWCPIYDPPEMCPKCSAKYEEYEVARALEDTGIRSEAQRLNHRVPCGMKLGGVKF